MKRGILVAYIVPTEERVCHLRETYGFAEQDLYLNSDFRIDFKRSWDEYKRFLREECNITDDLPNKAATRMLMFEWGGDFPMTPCGRIVSLIGISRRWFGSGSHRILERGPFAHNKLALVPQISPNENLLYQFIKVVINNCTSIYNPDITACNDNSYKWFIDELNNRMSESSQEPPAIGPYY